MDDQRRVGGLRISQLAGVQQCFDTGVEADKGAKLGDAADAALDHLPDMVHLFHARPGIFLQALQAQSDALALGIETEDVHLHLVADVQHLARVIDAVPRQLADMDQTVGATQIDECAKVAQPADHTLTGLALFQLVEQQFLARVAVATLGVTLAEHQTAALAVDLDHLHMHGLTDQTRHTQTALVFVQPARQVDHMAGGDKAAQIAEGHDQAAAIGVTDHTFPDFFIVHQFFGALPVFGLRCLGDGEQQIAILVLHAQDHHVDFLGDLKVTHVHTSALQVTALYHAVPFHALDADDESLPIDGDDDTGDDIAAFGRLFRERCLKQCCEIELVDAGL